MTDRSEATADQVRPAEMPAWLGPKARECWQRYAPHIEAQGHLNALFEMTFALLCSNLGAWQGLREILDREGWTVAKGGRRSRHPLLGPYLQYSRLLLRQCADFGLAPPSAARLARDEDRAARRARRALALVR